MSPEFIKNFQVHLLVENVDDWYSLPERSTRRRSRGTARAWVDARNRSSRRLNDRRLVRLRDVSSIVSIPLSVGTIVSPLQVHVQGHQGDPFWLTEMTPTTTAAIGALSFGLVAVLVLLPMAMSIPARLQDQWSRDMEAHARAAATREGVDYSYTTAQKSLLVLVAALVGYGVAWKYGSGARSVAYALYFLSAVLLAAINLKHALLPDIVVLSTLWAGLLFQASSGNGAESVQGAAVGYLVPLIIAVSFRQIAGKEIMGGGDLKTLAMAGAWFGLGAMPAVFGAFVLGSALWLVAAKLAGQKARGFIPTGPAHLAASIAAAMVAGI